MRWVVTVGRVPVGGTELVYDHQGAGPPLVLVHGTGTPASTWGGAVGDLAAGGYRVIAYDRRGYGRSTHRPVRDYRVHVADLATLVQHLGTPAHLVGWSSGGSVALALAAQHPQLCRSVVVIEATWHGLRYATSDLVSACTRLKLLQLRGCRREAAAVFFRWVSGLRDGRTGFDALPTADQQTLLANGRIVLAETDPHLFGPLMEHLSTKRLAVAQVPITWLLGAETRTQLFGKLRTQAVRVAPNIQSGLIMGAGHFAHRDAPRQFATSVLRAVTSTYNRNQ